MTPITNGIGWDLAVLENGFRDTYLELAFVEVYSNGRDFVRFDNVSLTPGPVPTFARLDPTDVDGLSGKYRKGYGTPFDLEDLADAERRRRRERRCGVLHRRPFGKPITLILKIVVN